MLPIPAGLGPESAGSLITCRATRHRGDRQSLDLTDAGAARVDSVEVFGLSGTGVDTLVLVRQSRGKQDAAAIIRLIVHEIECLIGLAPKSAHPGPRNRPR